MSTNPREVVEYKFIDDPNTFGCIFRAAVRLPDGRIRYGDASVPPLGSDDPETLAHTLAQDLRLRSRPPRGWK